MAVITYRMNDVAASGGIQFRRMNETDQAAATTGTGWTVGKSANATSSAMQSGTEQAAATFTTEASNPKPSVPSGNTGNGLRSENPVNGVFANTNWTITIVWRSVTIAHSGTLRVRVRVFRGPEVAGVDAVELTGSTQVGGTSAAGSTSADISSAVTWAPGAAFTLRDEFLFVIVAMEIVTASGSNTADALLRTGSAATTGTRVLTSDFAPDPPRNSGTNFQDPGVFAKAWRKKIGRIFVPDLWLPNPKQPLPVL